MGVHDEYTPPYDSFRDRDSGLASHTLSSTCELRRGHTFRTRLCLCSLHCLRGHHAPDWGCMVNITPRDQVLKMLRLAATGQPGSTEALLQLAATVEEGEMVAEQKQAKPEAIPEPPSPIIPSLDEAIAIASGRKGVKTVDPAKLARMSFVDAASAWYEANRHRLRRRMAYGVHHGIKQLGKFFTDTRLDKIHIGHILAYQEERSSNSQGRWKKSAGASCVNHEVGYLAQILRTAGLWEPLAKLYTPLASEGFKTPKVMDDVEKRRFFAVAASRPEWSFAMWVATITANTSASGVELRNLQLADLLLDENPPIIVNAATAKCYSRGRSLELNGPALGAVLNCVERAKGCGSVRPEHYLFPKLLRATNGIPHRPRLTHG